MQILLQKGKVYHTRISPIIRNAGFS